MSMENSRFEMYGITWEVTYGIDAIVKGKSRYLGYQEIIDLLHPHVKWVHEQDNDYQGEFFSCGYDKEGKWYFIQGSFGSCSGCDWLQSIGDIDGAKAFLKHFKKVVIVKDFKEDIIDYMTDTLLNVSWSEDTLKTLIIKTKRRRGPRK